LCILENADDSIREQKVSMDGKNLQKEVLPLWKTLPLWAKPSRNNLLSDESRTVRPGGGMTRKILLLDAPEGTVTRGGKKHAARQAAFENRKGEYVSARLGNESRQKYQEISPGNKDNTRNNECTP